jgi:hypothetical protein
MPLLQKYNKLPKTIQYTILGGSAILLYLLYKKFFGIETDQAETYEQMLKRLQEEKDKNTQNLTYPVSNYSAFANILHESMKYAVGDNYGAVTDIMMKMQNDRDVITLIEAYGLRQLYFFGIPTGEPLDLFTTIKKELGDEFGLLSVRVSNINKDWKKKNIKYEI